MTEETPMNEFNELLESVKQHVFDSARQNWLFGAGISCEANIPLMHPLTDLVKSKIESEEGKECNDVVSMLTGELPDDSHIEHYLSHLADLIAISERSRNESVTFAGVEFPSATLKNCYKELVKALGEIVRYGHLDDEYGSIENSLVDIATHLEFVRSIRLKKANLERRANTVFFTTNYDTLLEDALAMNKVHVTDGFSGGAMGFWAPEFEFSDPMRKINQCRLYKLHGSVDWHSDSEHGLVRVRYGSKYMADTSDIMIYPQASKYVETQKDPFASLFAGFKAALSTSEQNVLIICGYSFGDDHINSLIESALAMEGNNTTLVAFTKEVPGEGVVINPTLDKLLATKGVADRVFVAGENGIYNSSTAPAQPLEERQFDWWKFSGLIKFIKSGEI